MVTQLNYILIAPHFTCPGGTEARVQLAWYGGRIRTGLADLHTWANMRWSQTYSFTYWQWNVSDSKLLHISGFTTWHITHWNKNNLNKLCYWAYNCVNSICYSPVNTRSWLADLWPLHLYNIIVALADTIVLYIVVVTTCLCSGVLSGNHILPYFTADV